MGADVDSSRTDDVPRDAHPYCALYCEENIWQLAGHAALLGRRCEVWLITNPTKSVAMWAQRASPDPTRPVVWDYHVVLTSDARDGGARQLWDFDHRGPFVQSAGSWLEASFPVPLPPEFAPHFHCIEGDVYRRDFASDRAHMRDPDNPAHWTAAPPSWPEIGQGRAPNLLTWLDSTHAGPGAWLDLQSLNQRLRGHHA